MDNFKGLGIDGYVEVNPKDIVMIKAKGTYTIVFVKKGDKVEEVIFYLKSNVIIDFLTYNKIEYKQKSKDNEGLLTYHYE